MTDVVVGSYLATLADLARAPTGFLPLRALLTWIRVHGLFIYKALLTLIRVHVLLICTAAAMCIRVRTHFICAGAVYVYQGPRALYLRRRC